MAASEGTPPAWSSHRYQTQLWRVRAEPREAQGPGSPGSLGLSCPQLCIDLGWKPKYGRFDVLPLVLQADGRDPELFVVLKHENVRFSEASSSGVLKGAESVQGPRGPSMGHVES